MGDRFGEDPFVLFQLRGRTPAKLLEDLAEYRRKALDELAEQADASKRPAGVPGTASHCPSSGAGSGSVVALQPQPRH